MPKKRTHHTSSSTSHKKSAGRAVKETHIHHHSEMEEKLLKNMVDLQKVQTDLTEKFDHLGKELSKLLALFELSARNFAKNAPLGEYEKDKEFLEKMDKLLDQNKLLAKGLTMMEDHLRERMYGVNPAPVEQPKQMQQPAKPEDMFKQSGPSSRRPLPHF